MTKSDYIRYTRTRKELTLTAKGFVLSGYWRVRRTNWITVSGFAGVLLGLQILSNAMLHKSTALVVVSLFFIIVGLKISSRWNR